MGGIHPIRNVLRIDNVEKPKPRAGDVLIAVKSCGVIPNMNAIFSGTLWNHLPPLPASVGLDAAGVVAEVGERVVDIHVGDRVYVNPWLSCGQCAYCRSQPMCRPHSGLLPFYPIAASTGGVSIRGFSEFDGIAAAACETAD
jgi:NADPH:quinone reductase-like Zn-dependent oxidoreductase